MHDIVIVVFRRLTTKQTQVRKDYTVEFSQTKGFSQYSSELGRGRKYFPP